MPQTGTDRWFVVQIKPNGTRLARENLGRQGFEIFAPERLEGRAERRKPLFPGYLFVRFDPMASGWQAIRSTRGVTRLLTTQRHAPAPMPDGFVAALMAQCDAEGVFLPAERMDPGDRVRIASGPFADLIGRIEKLDANGRLTVFVELLGQVTRTEVEARRVVRA